jgi:hypothetical protein
MTWEQENMQYEFVKAEAEELLALQTSEEYAATLVDRLLELHHCPSCDGHACE